MLVCMMIMGLRSALVMQYILGSFNNKAQAIKDASNNRPTAALGGHEEVTLTCIMHPSHNNVVIASYCLGDDVSNPFRYRCYEFLDEVDDTGTQLMKIYRPLKSSQQKMKMNSYDIAKYLPRLANDFKYVVDCDIVWRKHDNEMEGYKGTLLKDPVYIYSTERGEKLLVKDDLNVFKNEVHINDRVYTLDGKQVIGNTHGLPYILQRLNIPTEI